MKTKKCIRCGVRIHPTDWIILKEMAYLPICDNCLLAEDKNNVESLYSKQKTKSNKNNGGK